MVPLSAEIKYSVKCCTPPNWLNKAGCWSLHLFADKMRKEHINSSRCYAQQVQDAVKEPVHSGVLCDLFHIASRLKGKAL